MPDRTLRKPGELNPRTGHPELCRCNPAVIVMRGNVVVTEPREGGSK